jgi:hypothetical protein
MTALKKTPRAIKCSDHNPISLIAHAAHVVVNIPRRKIERKIEVVLEKTSKYLEEEK